MTLSGVLVASGEGSIDVVVCAEWLVVYMSQCDRFRWWHFIVKLVLVSVIVIVLLLLRLLHLFIILSDDIGLSDNLPCLLYPLHLIFQLFYNFFGVFQLGLYYLLVFPQDAWHFLGFLTIARSIYRHLISNVTQALIAHNSLILPEQVIVFPLQGFLWSFDSADQQLQFWMLGSVHEAGMVHLRWVLEFFHKGRGAGDIFRSALVQSAFVQKNNRLIDLFGRRNPVDFINQLIIMLLVDVMLILQFLYLVQVHVV